MHQKMQISCRIIFSVTFEHTSAIWQESSVSISWSTRNLSFSLLITKFYENEEFEKLKSSCIFLVLVTQHVIKTKNKPNRYGNKKILSDSYLTNSKHRILTDVEFGLVNISTVCGGDSHFKEI